MVNQKVYPLAEKEKAAKKTNCMSGRSFQYVAAIIGGLSSFSTGVSLGWSSQITEELLDGKMGFPISSDEMGWIGSFLSLGAITSTLFTGLFCDRFGRKKTMVLLAVPKTVGWCLIIWADGVTMVYLGRFLIGLAAGPYFALSAIYIGEIAEEDLKSRLGSFTALMVNIGTLYPTLTGYVFNIRIFTISCAVIPLIFVALLVFMPETPVYLIRKGEIEEARSALRKIRNVSYNIENEIKEIQNNTPNETSVSFIFAALKKSEIQKACLIGFILMIFRKTSGVDALNSYTSYIFLSAQLQLDSKIQTIIMNVIGTITSLFQVYVIRKVDEKLLVLVSSFVITLSWTMLATVFLLKNRNIISPDYYIYVDYLPLAATILYIIAFALGLGPVPWIYLGELFPQDLKSFAVSTGTFLMWLFSFMVTKVFLIVDSSLGTDVAFYMFAISGLVTFLFTAILVPRIRS